MAPRTPLSLLDASFLYLEKPTEPLHVGAVTILDGAPAFEALAATLAARLGDVPRYRERPVRPLMDLAAACWERDPAFDSRRHIRRATVPAPGTDAALRGVVDALFAAPLDPAHPLWESYVIEGLNGGRTAILSKVHHCMIDGVSGAHMLAVMTDPLGGTDAAPPAPRREPAPATSWLPDVGGFLTTVRGLADAAVAAATVTTTTVTPLPFNGRLSAARRIVWASFALDPFLAMRGAAGCKVNDVVLAVIAGALRRYLGDRGAALHDLRPRIVVPVNVRRAEEAGALGNRVSAMFASLPLDIADPIERLEWISTQMRALKEHRQQRAFELILGAAALAPTVFGAPLTRLLSRLRIANLVCTNVPGSREPRHILGHAITAMHPIVPLALDMGLGFAILSYGGRLSISATVDPSLVPDADRLADALEAAAVELAARLHVPLDAGAPAPTRAAEPAAAAAPCVADIMTGAVITLDAHETLGCAWRIMHEHRIRHLPIVDRRGALLGIVTHRDLLAASQSTLSARTDAERVRLLEWAIAGDVMETHLSTVRPDTLAADAGTRMLRHKIGCLPVVDDDGRLAGIVTEEDFLHWATVHMAGGPHPRREVTQ
jgi:WS/DGAT/MGAT family acyltransferase